MTFYSDPACTVAVSALTIAAGTTTASFYFRDTVVGTPTVTVAPAGLGTASQIQSVGVAPAAALAFTTAPQALIAGACSAAVTVEARDALGNPTSVLANTAIALSSSSAGGAFHLAAGCGGAAVTSATMLVGTSQLTVYYRDTLVGAPALTAAASALTPATQGATVGAGPMARLAITQVTIAAGQGSAGFFFRGTAAGQAPVTATAAGLPVATQTQTITPGTARRLAFFAQPSTVAAGAVISPDVHGAGAVGDRAHRASRADPRPAAGAGPGHLRRHREHGGPEHRALGLALELRRRRGLQRRRPQPHLPAGRGSGR